ncbi:hypothetical protein EPU35_08195, partial [Escherichia coli]
MQDCTPLSVSLRYGTPRVQEKKMTTMNPFLVQSTLPYLAPHFDQISNHHGFAPIFPDTCYHLTHYWPAAADIPVASDNPVH